jgi:hypothetical protein
VVALKFLRILGRILFVLAGAFFVVTGLSSIPKMFVGIGLILVGVFWHVAFTALIRKRDPQAVELLLPAGKPDRNILTRLLRQPELYIVLFGFLLNFWWEVSQIPFYTGINRGKPYFGENTVAMKSFFVTTFWRASFLDALLVLGGHLLMTQIYQNRYWFVHSEKGKPSWLGYVVVTGVCVAFLVYLEVSAFDKGLWGYSEIMPTLFTKIGVIPVAALCWTPTIILLLARRVMLSFNLTKVKGTR